MAVYKVAQDVEADDKLIGPFSFRQFIYLLIVAGSVALAWALSRIFIGLAILPLPIIVFFGALALPLRKDQPMEIYLAAVLSYHLKPRKRLWIPDGIESLVTITAPKTVEVQRTKEFGGEEAERRLSYLASIADSQGWAIRNIAAPQAGSPMVDDYYNEAQSAVDVLDATGTVSQSFDVMIDRAAAQRRQAMIANMHASDPLAATYSSRQLIPQAPVQQVYPQYQQTPQFTAATPTGIPLPAPSDPYASLGAHTPMPDPVFNPYPTNIHQTVIQPLSPQDQLSTPYTPEQNIAPPETLDSTPKTTSETALSPDIINLANNADLSIETIAREAHRIEKKLEDEEEVVISLR